MRRAARRDANEGPLVTAARKLGAVLYRYPPLDWWCAHRGRWVPVEIKTPEMEGLKNEYTPLQRAFIAACDREKVPVWTWRTTFDVEQCLEANNEP